MPNINLSWKAPTGGEEPTEYRIFRKTGALSGSQEADGFGSLDAAANAAGGITGLNQPHISSASWKGSDQSFADTAGLGADTTYHYCVAASKNGLLSDFANAQDTNPTGGTTGGKVFTVTTAP